MFTQKKWITWISREEKGRDATGKRAKQTGLRE
jgi:hypothetical protein